MLPAVAEVDDHAQGHPDEEPGPVFPAQAGHQVEVRQDADDGEDGDKGRLEGTWQLGMSTAHDDDAAAHEHESEERADAGHFSYDLDRDKRREGADEDHEQQV